VDNVSTTKNINYPALISVLIPVYNQAKYLRDTLNSVLKQTYQNLEIIISDDCSTDRSEEIIQQYASGDKRIVVIKNSTNIGLCENFNQVFDAATGDYIAFFSGDDIMYPSKLESQLKILLDNPQIALVHHNAWVIDDNNNRKYLNQQKGLPAVHPLDVGLNIDWFHIKKIALFLPTTCLARREYYLHSRYNPALIRKHELLFIIQNYYADPDGKWYYIKEPLADYRIHEDNFTNNKFYSSYINEERMTMPEMVKQLCPGLKNKAEKAKIFFVNEALLFKYYENAEEKQGYLKYFNDKASLSQKAAFRVGKFLQSLKLYWVFSKLLHTLFYKPYHGWKHTSS